MNKLISTETRVFNCVCGSSEPGKTHLIMNMLKQNNGIFQHRFEKFFIFTAFGSLCMIASSKKVLQNFFFEDCSDLKKFPVGTSRKTNPLHKISSPVKLPSQQSSMDSLIENLLNHQMKDSGFQTVSGNDKVLAIFDDSCDDVSESASFANLATAGRQKGVSVSFFKHILPTRKVLRYCRQKHYPCSYFKIAENRPKIENSWLRAANCELCFPRSSLPAGNIHPSWPFAD